jgi:hypothetical protein
LSVDELTPYLASSDEAIHAVLEFIKEHGVDMNDVKVNRNRDAISIKLAVEQVNWADNVCHWLQRNCFCLVSGFTDHDEL